MIPSVPFSPLTFLSVPLVQVKFTLDPAPVVPIANPPMSRVPPLRLKLNADVPAPPARVMFPAMVRLPPVIFTLAVALVLLAADAPVKVVT